MVAGKILSIVKFESDNPFILMWDYTTATMFAWVFTGDYPATLITLNLETGHRIKTIVNFRNLISVGGTKPKSKVTMD